MVVVDHLQFLEEKSGESCRIFTASHQQVIEEDHDIGCRWRTITEYPMKSQSVILKELIRPHRIIEFMEDNMEKLAPLTMEDKGDGGFMQ